MEIKARRAQFSGLVPPFAVELIDKLYVIEGL